MSTDQFRSAHRRQVEAAVETMRAVWHPTGAVELPGDAYVPYATRVVSLLTSDADDVEIADYLGEVEQSDMGLAPRAGSDLLHVARRIRAAVAASATGAT